MPLLIFNLVVLAMAAMVCWWLSGYDAHLSGEKLRRDYLRRAWRCLLGLLIFEGIFLYQAQRVRHFHPASTNAYFLMLALLGLVNFDCLSRLGERLKRRSFGDEELEGFHPEKEKRLLEQIGRFIRSGKKAEAIELCKSLKASGEVSPAALDMTLEHLGVPQDTGKINRPLATAHRLRAEGKFDEAASLLKSLLVKSPGDLDVAMPLMRIYAQDQHEPQRAWAVLNALEKQPHVSAPHLDFARRSIDEWSRPRPKPVVEAGPEGSVDELMAQGFIGTAIEMLEEQTEAEPGNFALKLKLAAFYARHANNLPMAERIVQQMESQFSQEKLKIARARLLEWRKRTVGHRSLGPSD